MKAALAALARPLLFALDPERAHRLAISALALAPSAPPAPDPRLTIDAFGLSFPNPIGMAAGFDKNAEAPDGLLGFGFGFVEVGTLTPLPQPGNPLPRLFRLPRDQALINRLGFNNQGYVVAQARLTARSAHGIVGVNIGANKASRDRIEDYAKGVAAFSDVASYFTVNISSPNTPGLRDLQEREALDRLVARVLEARETSAHRRPILVKIAPDIDLATLDGIVSVARTRGVDGMVVSNTTIARPPSLVEPAAKEAGGLSGRPLFQASTKLLAQTYRRVEGAFPLIGCGGVENADTAYAKIQAGATLVQLYTALIYRGPAVVADILSSLRKRLEKDDLENLAAAIGIDARAVSGE
jgi:dihydroorotate dehydrogenase